MKSIQQELREARSLVLFKNGTSANLPVYLYQGACFIGDPTAYVVVNGSTVWIKPGESVAWIEA